MASLLQQIRQPDGGDDRVADNQTIETAVASLWGEGVKLKKKKKKNSVFFIFLKKPTPQTPP
jgi:hypothetical protein